MKINIRSKNIKLNSSLKKFVEKKIGSLDKFLGASDKKRGILRRLFTRKKPTVEAWVELEKTTQHHRKGPYFRAECQLKLGGKDIRAEAATIDLRMAVVEVKDELQREIKQYKAKRKDNRERKQRFLKKLFRTADEAKFEDEERKK